MTPTEKAKQEICEHDWKIIGNESEVLLQTYCKKCRYRNTFDISTLDEFIKSKVQKAHDLARQEFEKEKKEFCYDYQKSHLDCVIKARGQERLSFAQKLEEIFDEIEEKANEFYFDGWEDFKKQKIDSLLKLKPEGEKK